MTIALASTIGVLLAYDVPFPLEAGALSMVGLVIWHFVRREVRTDSHLEGEVTQLRDELQQLRADHAQELAALRTEVAEQHHLKHEKATQLAALENALLLVGRAAQRCTCQALDVVAPLFERT